MSAARRIHQVREGKPNHEALYTKGPQPPAAKETTIAEEASGSARKEKPSAVRLQGVRPTREATRLKDRLCAILDDFDVFKEAS